MSIGLDSIWEALDNDQYDHALSLITKARQRKPNDRTLIQLHAYSYARTNQIEDALQICREIRTKESKSEQTLQRIRDIFKGCNSPRARQYILEVAEGYYKDTKSEWAALNWFFDAVRSFDHVNQRRAAMELQKGWILRDYFYFVLSSMLLLWQESQIEKEKSLLGMLMYRMITKAAEQRNHGGTAPSVDTVEEFMLYIEILRKLDKVDDAKTACLGYHGARWMYIHEIKLITMEVLLFRDAWRSEAYTFAREQIESGEDDWVFFEPLTHDDSSLLFLQARADTQPGRNTLLARVAATRENLLDECITYFRHYSSKLVCYEDLRAHIQRLDIESHKQFLELAGDITSSYNPIDQIISYTNIVKFTLLLSTRTDVDLQPTIELCAEKYQAGLKLGGSLLTTDNQYSDDLLLLLCHCLLKSSSEESKIQALAILNYGLSRSKHNFQIKLQLIQLYRSLGAWTEALVQYTSLNVKEMQHDTLSHLIISPYEFPSQAQVDLIDQSLAIYKHASIEIGEMSVTAFRHGTYSKITEFNDLRNRLEYSTRRARSMRDKARLHILLDQDFENTELQGRYNNDSKLSFSVLPDQDEGFMDEGPDINRFREVIRGGSMELETTTFREENEVSMASIGRLSRSIEMIKWRRKLGFSDSIAPIRENLKKLKLLNLQASPIFFLSTTLINEEIIKIKQSRTATIDALLAIKV